MISEFLDRIEEIARAAGEMMLTASEELKVESKGGHANFVTQYDRRIQQFIEGELHRAFPGAEFFGEEDEPEAAGDADIDTDGEFADLLFIVDPIDGTTNFIKGFRPSVTSIGVLKAGEPFAGVIYDPYDDLLFAAQKGLGAYENGKRIHASDEPLSESLVIMGTSPYYEGAHQRAFELANRYLELAVDVRRTGTAAWDLCQVASGRVGLFYEPVLCPWDFTAGLVIVTEAGGRVTDFEGNVPSFTEKSTIAAASKGVLGGKYLPSEI